MVKWSYNLNIFIGFIVKVVILCGGYGTRIRDVADDIPKPMIPIGGLPILWHIMKYYAGMGHKDFILCVGYKSFIIKDFFLNYKSRISDFTISLNNNNPIIYHNRFSEADWNVTLAETGLKSLTGARIYRIRKYLDGEENFMLTYGDGVGNININELIAFHLSHNKIITITGVKPPGRFGELVKDSTGKIAEFNEKPQSAGGLISGGFMVCRKEIFNYLSDKENLMFEQEPMDKLVNEGQAMVYEHEGFWQPMDTSRDYQFLNELYESGKAPWVIW